MVTLPLPPLPVTRPPAEEQAREEEETEEHEGGLTVEREQKSGELVVVPRRIRSASPLAVVHGRSGTGTLVQVTEVAPLAVPPMPAAVQQITPTVSSESLLLNMILNEMQDLNQKMAVQTEPVGVRGTNPFEVKVIEITSTLTTVGDVVQGPNFAVPVGFETMVRMRRHTGAPNGYMSFTRQGVIDPRARIEFRDNDNIYIRAGNWNQLFFGADTFGSNTQIRFELAVEQNPRGLR